MAAKDVRFSSDARDKMIRGVLWAMAALLVAQAAGLVGRR